jgi:4-amino-4-deoxy-L-arabinose transferase-like glycosyltransferase
MMNIITEKPSKIIAWSLILVIISLFMILISGDFLIEGMFMDGTVYASVARNLSLGIGDFWHLKMSETVFSNFHEQFPLAIWLESLFFRLLGTSIYVERVYSLTTFFISSGLIILIWKTLKKDFNTSFLPLIFWILISRVSWAVYCNMIENTLTIFILLSILFYLKFILEDKKWAIILAGVFLFLAFLTKSLFALFVISMPVIIWISGINKDFKALVKSMTLFLLPMFTIGLFSWFFWTDFRLFLIGHWNEQVLKSLSHETVVQNRFSIVFKFFEEIVFSVLLMIIFWTFDKFKSKPSALDTKWIVFFVVLSFCGVFPFVISLKQHPHYLVAAYPFVSLALALAVENFVKNWLLKLNLKTPKISLIVFAIGLFVASIVLNINSLGKTTRDPELVSEVKKISSIVGENAKLSICNHHFSNWTLVAYFARYSNISLYDYRNPQNSKFYLDDGSCSLDCPSGYQLYPVELKKFKLYQLKVN